MSSRGMVFYPVMRLWLLADHDGHQDGGLAACIDPGMVRIALYDDIERLQGYGLTHIEQQRNLPREQHDVVGRRRHVHQRMPARVDAAGWDANFRKKTGRQLARLLRSQIRRRCRQAEHAKYRAARIGKERKLPASELDIRARSGGLGAPEIEIT